MTETKNIATGRSGSMFAPTLEVHRDVLTDRIKGARVLAIGAAGSIGANTAQTIAQFGPACLHLLDQNENALAEFIRQFWSMKTPPDIGDLRLLPLDYGAPVTKAFLSSQEPYDIVLNFAAIKHVRSEKDTFSILQMLDTNIVKQARFLTWLQETSPDARYFSVSTDKAANPVSFMGATKRIMEHVLFAPEIAGKQKGGVTSARFANVAFSNGSILQSFENRLARREPLAAPEGIRRYFVSLEESGHICTLASLLLPNQHIGVPDLDPEQHLVPIKTVATNFLAHHNLDARTYTSSAEAIANLENDAQTGHWPLILTPSDTAGEKPYEEFVAAGESRNDTGLGTIHAVPWAGLQHGGDIKALVTALEDLVLGRAPLPSDKLAIKKMLAMIEPEFMSNHIESAASLDQRA